jgi:hypothetical protein
LLAKNWQLSREYSAVIACHHGAEFEHPLNQGELDLLNIIKIADKIAFFFGMGFKRETDIFNLSYPALGLSKKKFEEIIWHVDRIYEEYIESLTF